MQSDTVAHMMINAGYFHRPARESASAGRASCAFKLGRAVALADLAGVNVTWQFDDMPWDGDVEYNGPLWGCTVGLNVRAGCGHRETLTESLWGIAIDSSDPGADSYGRTVEAELCAQLFGV